MAGLDVSHPDQHTIDRAPPQNIYESLREFIHDVS